MLSNAYFLAKFRFDTVENEPAKNLQNFANNFLNFANPNLLTLTPQAAGSRSCSALRMAGLPQPRAAALLGLWALLGAPRAALGAETCACDYVFSNSELERIFSNNYF